MMDLEVVVMEVSGGDGDVVLMVVLICGGDGVVVTGRKRERDKRNK